MIVNNSGYLELLHLVTIEKFRQYRIKYYINKETNIVYCEGWRPDNNTFKPFVDIIVPFERHNKLQPCTLIQQLKKDLVAFEKITVN